MVNLFLMIQAKNSTSSGVVDAELALEFPVISVRDFETAEDLMSSIGHDINLILLGAALGQSRTVEFCKRRRCTGFRGLLVVFSGSAYDDERLEVEAAGADAFLVIGSSAREIAGCVSALLCRKG